MDDNNNTNDNTNDKMVSENNEKEYATEQMMIDLGDICKKQIENKDNLIKILYYDYKIKQDLIYKTYGFLSVLDDTLKNCCNYDNYYFLLHNLLKELRNDIQCIDYIENNSEIVDIVNDTDEEDEDMNID